MFFLRNSKIFVAKCKRLISSVCSSRWMWEKAKQSEHLKSSCTDSPCIYLPSDFSPFLYNTLSFPGATSNMILSKQNKKEIALYANLYCEKRKENWCQPESQEMVCQHGWELLGNHQHLLQKVCFSLSMLSLPCNQDASLSGLSFLTSGEQLTLL